MESLFYGLDCDKDSFFEDCLRDPLTDVGGNLWPLLTDPPVSQTSALTCCPEPTRNAGSCTHESQDESAQVGYAKIVVTCRRVRNLQTL